VETDRLQRAQRRFATGARTLDFDFQRADAMFGGLLAGVFGADLRRVRGRLVMVIIVLLKVALTWATPDEMFLRSRRRRRCGSRAMMKS
jgi:hypothetical protein